MSRLIQAIPAPLIRFAGQLQFRVPVLKPIIRAIGYKLASGEGVIKHGAGKGLRFDATGCNPGFLAGTSEPLEQELLARYCSEGGVVYDLGANAGFYSTIAAKLVGPTGKVFAFEPSPELVKQTRKNAQINSFSNVEVIEAAVSDTDGEISFGVVDTLSVSNSIRSASEENSIRVKSVKLDSFCKSNAPPQLLLMDIEGAEIAALTGALETIATHKPVMMVEVHWLGQEFIDFIETRILPLGYTVSTYDGDSLPTGKERYHTLFVPQSQ